MKNSLLILLLATFGLGITAQAQNRSFWRHEQKQQNVGSCHTFATLALLEAEYYLVHGKNIDLSERDLFTRHLMRGHRTTDEMIRSQLTAAAHQKLSPFYKEAASPKSDFDLVKTYGVALENEVPYESTFSAGMPTLMEKLRHLRSKINNSAQKLKTSGQLSRSNVQQLVSKHMDNSLSQKLGSSSLSGESV